MSVQELPYRFANEWNLLTHLLKKYKYIILSTSSLLFNYELHNFFVVTIIYIEISKCLWKTCITSKRRRWDGVHRRRLWADIPFRRLRRIGAGWTGIWRNVGRATSCSRFLNKKIVLNVKSIQSFLWLIISWNSLLLSIVLFDIEFKKTESRNNVFKQKALLIVLQKSNTCTKNMRKLRNNNKT
jgi:hypothetical protein